MVFELLDINNTIGVIAGAALFYFFYLSLLANAASLEQAALETKLTDTPASTSSSEAQAQNSNGLEDQAASEREDEHKLKYHLTCFGYDCDCGLGHIKPGPDDSIPGKWMPRETSFFSEAGLRVHRQRITAMKEEMERSFIAACLNADRIQRIVDLEASSSRAKSTQDISPPAAQESSLPPPTSTQNHSAPTQPESSSPPAKSIQPPSPPQQLESSSPPAEPTETPSLPTPPESSSVACQPAQETFSGAGLKPIRPAVPASSIWSGTWIHRFRPQYHHHRRISYPSPSTSILTGNSYLLPIRRTMSLHPTFWCTWQASPYLIGRQRLGTSSSIRSTRICLPSSIRART